MELQTVEEVSTAGPVPAEPHFPLAGGNKVIEYRHTRQSRYRRARRWLAMFALAAAAGAARAAGPPDQDYASLEDAIATLALPEHTVQVGQPIWADFTICNPTSKPVILRFGDTAQDLQTTQPAVLPLEHVFSGPGLQALSVVSAADNAEEGWPTLLSGVGSSAPPLRIPPRGIFGIRVNLAEYYPGLLRNGTYYLTWRPYGGALASNRVRLSVTQLKQAVIETRFGDMTVAFEYEVAPRHVANFIELAESGFYNNKLFHLVIPGLLVHGGCPRGDGTGVRPDGKLLKPEFSDLPHRAGTVSMSRKANDPDSASCQFFICVSRIRELDGRYTAFGHLVGQESFDTLQKISQVPTDESDHPLQPVYIRRVRIENAPTARREPVTAVLR